MKDTIHIKQQGEGFNLTRTLSEDINLEDLNERILKVEHDIEAYTDARNNLIENKEEILAKNSEKIDKDIEAYGLALVNLQSNLDALKDAIVLGEGSATSIQEGDTQKGVN